MANDDLTVDVCMGCACYGGGVYQSGEGSVELSESEVQALVALMEQHNSSDVEQLQLDIALPELYKKLFVACHDAAYKANALHWIGEVWVCDEYDKQGLAEFCEQELGYEYNYDECPLDDDELEDYDEEEAELNARDIHLQSWLEDYLQSADIETLQTIYLDYLGFDECVFDMEQDAYCVVIPDEIVKMAKLS